MSYFPRLAAVLLPVALSLASPAARADTLSTFDFSGTCSDCTGSGTAALVLNNYTLGTAISASNFVSFTYNGTDLLAAFTITASPDVVVQGSIDEPLPGPETFAVFGDENDFSSSSTGFWCVGGGCVADYGFTHVWMTTTDATASVPEPMTIALLGGGLIGLAAVRRKS